MRVPAPAVLSVCPTSHRHIRTLRAPASVATSFASSTSTLKNARSGCWSENCSNVGQTVLQAPAHVAQKLTTAVRSPLICGGSEEFDFLRRNRAHTAAWNSSRLAITVTPISKRGRAYRREKPWGVDRSPALFLAYMRGSGAPCMTQFGFTVRRPPSPHADKDCGARGAHVRHQLLHALTSHDSYY
jgi:hypothetical protein